jgi:hypothetical protein
MKKYAIGLALLAVIGTASTVPPAFAQHFPVKCENPANVNDPDCKGYVPPARGQTPRPGPLSNSTPPANPPSDNPPPRTNSGFNINNNNNNSFGIGNSNGPGNNDNGGFNNGDNRHRGPGSFGGPGQHHDQGQEDQFRQLFNGFSAGMFARPFFDVRPGVTIPHSYRLRPVPRSIYRDYPEYYGYLFFIDRDGSIVIVSPRSHRIVDIL